MNVQIEKFLDTFNSIYSELYEAGDNVAGFDEAVAFFDEFTKQQPEFVGEFVKFRGDLITSDREAASFAYALSDYDHNLIDNQTPAPGGQTRRKEGTKMREQRKITNGSGKTITIMIDPNNTIQHIYCGVEWAITPAQWRRLVRESDNTAWRTERGATIAWTCYPFAAGCRYPGRS